MFGSILLIRWSLGAWLSGQVFARNIGSVNSLLSCKIGSNSDHSFDGTPCSAHPLVSDHEADAWVSMLQHRIVEEAHRKKRRHISDPEAFLRIIGSSSKALPHQTRSNLHETSKDRRAVLQVMWGKCDVGVFATHAMLKRHNFSKEHIVLVASKTLPPDCIKLLQAANISTEEIPNLQGKHELNRTYLEREKLAVFRPPAGLNVTGSRIIALETDAIPASSIEEVFEYTSSELPFWSASRSMSTFQLSSSVMAFRIYPRMFDELVDTIEHAHDSVGDVDQDILTYHFQVVKKFDTFLPRRYSILAPEFYQRYRGYNAVLSSPGIAKIVHYKEGGFAAWCHYLSRVSSGGSQLQLLWHDAGSATAMSIAAEQCCTTQEFLRRLPNNLLNVLNLPPEEPLSCNSLRTQIADSAALASGV